MPSTVTCFLSVQYIKIKHYPAGLEAASVLSWPKQFVLLSMDDGLQDQGLSQSSSHCVLQTKLSKGNWVEFIIATG